MDSTKKIGAFVTDLGVAMIANSTILGEKVDLKKFAIGDGAGAAYVPQPSMTELKNELWRGNISKCEIRKESQNVIETLLVVPPSVGGFTVRELGIFSNDNKLIAICSIPDIEKIKQENNAAMAMAFKVGIVVSNTDVITFEEKSIPIILTKKELETHNQSLSAHPNKADKGLGNVAASTIVEKLKAVDGAGSGLDADTVDGKHASDFAPSGFGLGTSCINLSNGTDLNNLPEKYKFATGFYMIASPVNKPEEIGGGWVYLLQMAHYNSEPAYIVQICFELNSMKEAGNIFIRQCVKGNWTPWKKPDASTVGGKSAADLQNYNNLKNKPVLKTVATTGSYNDLTDKPTTLPANGGNADTVDGKHATDFVERDDGHEIGTSYVAYGGVRFRVDVTENVPVAKALDADTVDGKHASDFAPSGFGLGANCTNLPNGADLNNLPEKYINATGFFMGANLQNKPERLNGWVYLIQQIHNEKHKVQLALMLNGGTNEWGNIFIRQCVDGTWKEWKKPDADTVGGKSVDVLYSNCSATVPTAYLGDHVQYQVY